MRLLFVLLTVCAALPAASQPIPAPIAEEPVEDGWLGIVLDDASGSVVVDRVLPGSPAEEAGIFAGEVILEAAGVPVSSTSALVETVRGIGAGSEAPFLVQNPDGQREVNVRLAARPDPTAVTQLLVGAPFPWVESADLDGEEVAPPADRNSWVVIEFWATWCGPCHHAAPRVVELFDEYSPQGVEFIGVAADPASTLRRFLSQNPLGWPQIADGEGDLNAAALVVAQPTWFLVARGGVVEGVYVGLPGLDELTSALAALSLED